MTPAANTEADLLRIQAEWLAPARSQLLRRAGISRRKRILDLGAGTGAVTSELVRRTQGTPGVAPMVVALDHSLAALQSDPSAFRGAYRVCADASRIPFPAACFDLVFCQCALMWMDVEAVAREVRRILRPGGVLVAIEPDYGGMIEYPETIASRALWVSALARAGADPLVARKLPSVFESLGFRTYVSLLSELSPPSPDRFRLLRALPLTPEECRQLDLVESRSQDASAVVHLPFFLLIASVP